MAAAVTWSLLAVLLIAVIGKDDSILFLIFATDVG